MLNLRSLLLVAMLIVAPPFAAFAGDAKAGALTINHPWARPNAGSAANGAAYLTIINGGADVDRLVEVASPAAAMVQLHTHLLEDGIMKMRHITGIDIEPGAPIKLEPGGLHIMLIGLKAPLKEGDSFPLDLIFKRAGKVTVLVSVEVADFGMGDMHHHQH
jgi:periplasmic copper chaperone A